MTRKKEQGSKKKLQTPTLCALLWQAKSILYGFSFLAGSLSRFSAGSLSRFPAGTVPSSPPAPSLS